MVFLLWHWFWFYWVEQWMVCTDWRDVLVPKTFHLMRAKTCDAIKSLLTEHLFGHQIRDGNVAQLTGCPIFAHKSKNLISN